MRALDVFFLFLSLLLVCISFRICNVCTTQPWCYKRHRIKNHPNVCDNLVLVKTNSHTADEQRRKMVENRTAIEKGRTQILNKFFRESKVSDVYCYCSFPYLSISLSRSFSYTVCCFELLSQTLFFYYETDNFEFSFFSRCSISVIASVRLCVCFLLPTFSASTQRSAKMK